MEGVPERYTGFYSFCTWRRMMRAKIPRLSKLLPNNEDDPGRRYFKLTVYLSVGIILIMVISSFIISSNFILQSKDYHWCIQNG